MRTRVAQYALTGLSVAELRKLKIARREDIPTGVFTFTAMRMAFLPALTRTP